VFGYPHYWVKRDLKGHVKFLSFISTRSSCLLTMAMTIFASGVSQQISTYLFTTAPEFKLSLQSTTDVSLGISPTCISVDRTGQAL
jgi:hypothetical protein